MPRLKMIRDFLSTQPFEVNNWPWNSPDLNPIDAWNFMKTKLKSHDISSVLKLKEDILKMWTQDMSQEYLRTLRDSMPRRIKAVIKTRGDMMKY